MSGGRPSGPQTAVGDHPSCTSDLSAEASAKAEARKDGETAGCARTPDLIRGKGLVLTEDGAAGPKQRKEVSPPGLAPDHAKDGSRMAETATGGLGSRQPDPPRFIGGCAKSEDQSSSFLR